jgi:hypothetical protein
MSNYWKLQRQIVIGGEDDPILWPAIIDLQFELEPSDLFGIPSPLQPLTTINGKSKFSVDGRTGKFILIETQSLEVANLIGNFQFGQIHLRGNIARLTATLNDQSHFVSTVNWLSVMLTQFLSVQVGIFIDIVSISGTVSGRPISVIYPSESYSLLLAKLDANTREEAFQDTLLGPNPNQQSYQRYIVSSRYFHHALRLLSPHQVNYIPYTAHAEVLLNLAKCIEILFSTSNRDMLRQRFRELGFNQSQIDSQIIPILVARNDIDVGHPLSGEATKEEIAVLRKFVDRSVKNVATILRVVAKRIIIQEDYLEPLRAQKNKDRQKLVNKLRGYLEEEGLDPELRSPVVISSK